MRAPDAKSHRVKESEQKFDESIGERVTLKRQKAYAVGEFSEQIAKIDQTTN